MFCNDWKMLRAQLTCGAPANFDIVHVEDDLPVEMFGLMIMTGAVQPPIARSVTNV
jgi:hypothetical protein